MESQVAPLPSTAESRIKSRIKRYIELTAVVLLLIVMIPFLILWHYKERAFQREDETRAGE